MAEEIPVQSIEAFLLNHRNSFSPNRIKLTPHLVTLKEIDTLSPIYHPNGNSVEKEFSRLSISSPLSTHGAKTKTGQNDADDDLEEGEILEPDSEVILQSFSDKKHAISSRSFIGLNNDDNEAYNTSSVSVIKSFSIESQKNSCTHHPSSSSPSDHDDLEEGEIRESTTMTKTCHYSNPLNLTEIAQSSPPNDEISNHGASLTITTKALDETHADTNRCSLLETTTNNALFPEAINNNGNTEWVLGFESPKKILSSSLENKLSTDKSPNPIVSLLDTSMILSSPNSQIKYTEKDVQRIIKSTDEKHQNEMELLQVEVATLQEKYETLLAQHIRLQKALVEYEETMKQMVVDNQKMKEEDKDRITQMMKSKDFLETELKAMETALKETKTKYSDMKIVNEGIRKNEEMLKEQIASLENDVIASEKRYEALKTHAEEKLSLASTEIEKSRVAYEKEISALKAKLTMTELSVKNMEVSLDQKTRENKELVSICDGLIQQLNSK